jgi:hypothetical protein
MSTQLDSLPTYPVRKSAAVHWRNFCEEWRHSYLLLAALFCIVWRVSAVPIPVLEDIRIGGALHPFDVLLLMRMLELMWVPSLAAVALYAVSFWVPRLNTASAIAVGALSSAALLAFVLFCALVHIFGRRRFPVRAETPNKEGCRAAKRSGASNYTPG